VFLGPRAADEMVRGEESAMRERLENLNLREVAPLIPPAEVKRKLPVTEQVGERVLRARQALRDALHGRDSERLVVIVGPCSLHDRELALAYAERLAPLADALAGELLVVMRTYFEKPRTTVGWKGLINDPQLDGSCDVPRGLELARELLLEIGARGLPCATEFLDPVTPQYISDLIAWGAIGARTTESQTHRELASGLSMPVGFKNGTDGNLKVALDAMISARHPHSFLGISAAGAAAVIKTAGNPDRHVVLRGGAGRPNYGPEDVSRAVATCAAEGVPRGVLVDCSHDNSGKNPARQGAVCRAVLDQARAGERGILGVMLESNLEAGRQDWQPGVPLRFGVSITDACIAWDETEALLREIAATARRGLRSVA
jgi:3-deoxy-7-phosphoheptulonate synthase